MKKETYTIEEVLAQALEMKESGISNAQIFEAFPDQTKDLKSFFDTIEILKKQTNHIQGSEEHFRKVLAALDTSPFLIRSPIQVSTWFKKYGLVLSAGATLALVFILNNRTPAVAPVAMNDDTNTTMVATEMTGDTVALTGGAKDTGNATPMMAKMAAAPSGSVDEVVSEINGSATQEGAYGNAARDKELAAYDKNDVNTFTTTSYENIY